MSRKRDCRTIAFVVCTDHTAFPGNNAGSGLLFNSIGFIYNMSIGIINRTKKMQEGNDSHNEQK